VSTVDDLIAAVRAEPPGHGFLAPGASPDTLAALDRDLGQPLPADLKELLLRSDGIGVSRSTGLYLHGMQGLRRLAFDDLYASAFPGALLIGDDGANGLYLVDVAGRFGAPPGGVLLTDRGSLLPRDTVLAGSSVSAVLAAVLAGEDLWSRARLSV
jgi:SMI1 / KNR4 family (SUKH-1)